MKIGITGHTKFLGKKLFELLSENNEVFGFSRSNGYNIENYEKILEKVYEMDVFINNTYHPTLQQEIFEKLFEMWKNEKKTIFNILTSAIFNGGSFDDYRESKINLQKSSINLIGKNLDKKVRVVNLYPNTMEHNKRVPFNKLNFSELCDIIKFQLDLPQGLELSHLCISRTTTLNDYKLF
jgi:hypothetical protein